MIAQLPQDAQDKMHAYETAISQELASLVGLGPDEKRGKNKDILTMIDYYNKLTDAVEGRRNLLHAHTLQLLAISVTGLGVAIAQENSIFTQWGNKGVAFLFGPIAAVLACSILFSLIAVLCYENQNAFRFPFLPLGALGSNKWKWFYYGNSNITRIDTRPLFPTHDFDKTVGPYMQGLREFVHNYWTETIDKELVDNVQQLYLLQVHNYFKNRWYLSLVAIRRKSLYAVILIVMLFAVVFAADVVFRFIR